MHSKPKILVVDDKIENIIALRTVLKDLDIELVEVTSGNDALKATLKNDFALALLDIQMPDMDGYELAEILRGEEKTMELPFIFISAVYTDNLNVFKGYEKGAFSFITKPFQPEILINKVKFFIEKHQQEIAFHRLNIDLQKKNVELSRQAEKLQVSEEELRTQQDKIIDANESLEDKTRLLEEKNAALQAASIQLQLKAKELELNSKYKSEFLANMSHELRTPLNSILLLSKLLAENQGNNLSADQVEYANVIYHAGFGLLELINEILDLSKIESGKIEIEFVETTIESISKPLVDLFKPMAKQKEIAFKLTQKKSIPNSIITDGNRLGQVLKNFLSNAFKFTDEGSISLIIRNPLLSEMDNQDELKNYIAFEVKDTGIGINEDKHEIIFEAFRQADGSTRRKYGGTGLGLSISKEIAHMLGGKVMLKSKLGKGSSFTLILPINPTSNQSKKQ